LGSGLTANRINLPYASELYPADLTAKLSAGMQRHRALPPESPGAVPSASRLFLSKAADQCFRAHLLASLAGTGNLEAAFHSPETTARFQAPISRSKLPTYLFDALPIVHRTRSDSDSSACFRFAPEHAGSLPKSRCPTSVRYSQPFLGSPLPFGAFRTLKDQSVQSDSWLKSSPSEHSRWPLTPQHQFCFNRSDAGSPLLAR